jgi:hypothetical protein
VRKWGFDHEKLADLKSRLHRLQEFKRNDDGCDIKGEAAVPKQS